jgi:transposase
MSMIQREQLPTATNELHDLVISLDQRNEHLQHQVEMLTRRLYGPSSEKRRDAAGQQELFELPAAPTPPEALQQAEVLPKSESKPQGHGRRKLPEHLLRQRFEYHPPEIDKPCPCCGSAWQKIGEEVSEQAELVPQTLVVLQHARIKYACRCKDKVLIGKVPNKIFDKGLAGPGLLADLIVKKVEFHLPLYRQEVLTEHLGFTLARSTQCQWLGACAERLEPLYLVGKQDALRAHLIHTDDTPVRVQEPGQGKTREGRFWVYLGDEAHPQTIFDYTPNRKRDGPQGFLKNYKGVLQADAYGGYDGIYAGGLVTEAGCWAHARRKFDEAQSTALGLAAEMLTMIGELYAIEKSARERKLPAGEIQKLREAHAVPVLARIKVWLDRQKLEVLPKSPLGLAVRYTLGQWAALNRYVSDGMIAIDNNLAENALRPITVGRKNWLFLGNDDGGRRLAILYSLVETCRRHEINPWEYLKDILVRIETQPPGTLHELLPAAWKKARAAPPQPSP